MLFLAWKNSGFSSLLASHVDVLTGSSRNRGVGTCDEPLRTFGWEATSLLVTGDVHEEECLRLSDKKFHFDDGNQVYLINLVVMGFQMQICSILRFS